MTKASEESATEENGQLKAEADEASLVPHVRALLVKHGLSRSDADKVIGKISREMATKEDGLKTEELKSLLDEFLGKKSRDYRSYYHILIAFESLAINLAASFLYDEVKLGHTPKPENDIILDDCQPKVLAYVPSERPFVGFDWPVSPKHAGLTINQKNPSFPRISFWPRVKTEICASHGGHVADVAPVDLWDDVIGTRIRMRHGTKFATEYIGTFHGLVRAGQFVRKRQPIGLIQPGIVEHTYVIFRTLIMVQNRLMPVACDDWLPPFEGATNHLG